MGVATQIGRRYANHMMLLGEIAARIENVGEDRTVSSDLASLAEIETLWTIQKTTAPIFQSIYNNPICRSMHKGLLGRVDSIKNGLTCETALSVWSEHIKELEKAIQEEGVLSPQSHCLFYLCRRDQSLLEEKIQRAPDHMKRSFNEKSDKQEEWLDKDPWLGFYAYEAFISEEEKVEWVCRLPHLLEFLRNRLSPADYFAEKNALIQKCASLVDSLSPEDKKTLTPEAVLLCNKGLFSADSSVRTELQTIWMEIEQIIERLILENPLSDNVAESLAVFVCFSKRIDRTGFPTSFQEILSRAEPVEKSESFNVSSLSEEDFNLVMASFNTILEMEGIDPETLQLTAAAFRCLLEVQKKHASSDRFAEQEILASKAIQAAWEKCGRVSDAMLEESFRSLGREMPTYEDFSLRARKKQTEIIERLERIESLLQGEPASGIFGELVKVCKEKGWTELYCDACFERGKQAIMVLDLPDSVPASASEVQQEDFSEALREFQDTIRSLLGSPSQDSLEILEALAMSLPEKLRESLTEIVSRKIGLSWSQEVKSVLRIWLSAIDEFSNVPQKTNQVAELFFRVGWDSESVKILGSISCQQIEMKLEKFKDMIREMAHQEKELDSVLHLVSQEVLKCAQTADTTAREVLSAAEIRGLEKIGKIQRSLLSQIADWESAQSLMLVFQNALQSRSLEAMQKILEYGHPDRPRTQECLQHCKSLLKEFPVSSARDDAEISSSLQMQFTCDFQQLEVISQEIGASESVVSHSQESNRLLPFSTWGMRLMQMASAADARAVQVQDSIQDESMKSQLLQMHSSIKGQIEALQSRMQLLMRISTLHSRISDGNRSLNAWSQKNRHHIDPRWRESLDYKMLAQSCRLLEEDTRLFALPQETKESITRLLEQLKMLEKEDFLLQFLEMGKRFQRMKSFDENSDFLLSFLDVLQEVPDHVRKEFYGQICDFSKVERNDIYAQEHMLEHFSIFSKALKATLDGFSPQDKTNLEIVRPSWEQINKICQELKGSSAKDPEKERHQTIQVMLKLQEVKTCLPTSSNLYKKVADLEGLCWHEGLAAMYSCEEYSQVHAEINSAAAESFSVNIGALYGGT